jgi:hypothetical protein
LFFYFLCTKSGCSEPEQNKEDQYSMPLPKIIRLNTVLDHTGLTRSTLYRKIAQGHVPAPGSHQHQRGRLV